MSKILSGKGETDSYISVVRGNKLRYSGNIIVIKCESNISRARPAHGQEMDASGDATGRQSNTTVARSCARARARRVRRVRSGRRVRGIVWRRN